jgi:hypothetical protein
MGVVGEEVEGVVVMVETLEDQEDLHVGASQAPTTILDKSPPIVNGRLKSQMVTTKGHNQLGELPACLVHSSLACRILELRLKEQPQALIGDNSCRHTGCHSQYGLLW